MTRADSLKTINCTSCGAGLDVLGGGRVQTHVCGYCGTSLNAQDNYKIIKKHTGLRRPTSPFQLGMTGDIDGVTFTVIGTLGYEETWGHKTWRWTDHQLFSPTHGYAYLTVEERHFTFTRRYRKSSSWLSPWVVEAAENRPVVTSAGDRYAYYDTSTSTLTFIEGEFNWQPKLGQQQRTVNAMSRDAVLSFSETANEREIERTTYLPHAQTCKSFGITDAPQPQSVHQLSPYKQGPHEAFLRSASIVFCLVSMLLLGILLGQSNDMPEFQRTVMAEDLPVELPFPITNANRLARVTLGADVSNSWSSLGLTVIDPNGTPLFEAGRTMEFYSGRDKDGYWSEGNATGSLTFMPTVAGQYILELELEEHGTWGREGTAFHRISVRIREGIPAAFWMVGLTLAFAAISAYHLARPMLHIKRRWWGSDWTDED